MDNWPFQIMGKTFVNYLQLYIIKTKEKYKFNKEPKVVGLTNGLMKMKHKN